MSDEDSTNDQPRDRAGREDREDREDEGREVEGREVEGREVEAVLSQLWQMLSAGEDLGEVLQRLVGIAVRLFPPGYEASITITATNDQPETVAATDRDVLPLDQTQYDADDGPCLEAARTRTPVHTDLDTARQRWPAFAETAEKVGVHGYLSAPLYTEHGVIGSFNVYSRRPATFDDIDAALLTLFTNSALAAVANAERHRQARDLVEQLRAALASRSGIDQAVGVLMARHGVPAEQAWDALSRESQDRNLKVRDLADQVASSVHQTNE